MGTILVIYGNFENSWIPRNFEQEITNADARRETCLTCKTSTFELIVLRRLCSALSRTQYWQEPRMTRSVDVRDSEKMKNERARERERVCLVTFSLSRQRRSSPEVYERGRAALSLVGIAPGVPGAGDRGERRLLITPR